MLKALVREKVLRFTVGIAIILAARLRREEFSEGCEIKA